MTPIMDRLTVTLAEAKLYLRVDHDAEDTLITELIDAAKAAADRFLNNPFTDADGNDTSIPDAVKPWVLRRVAYLYEQRVESARSDATTGLGTVDYGRAISDQGGTTDYSLIRPWRLNPGL